jgi:hypothetical protein
VNREKKWDFAQASYCHSIIFLLPLHHTPLATLNKEKDNIGTYVATVCDYEEVKEERIAAAVPW